MRMTKEVKTKRTDEKLKKETNFMGGVSYGLSPIETMKMVTASSIFGEPQYYRDGRFAEKTMPDGVYKVSSLFEDYSVLDPKFNGKDTGTIMEMVISDALDADFEATIRWADTLRHEYNMRLNPQVIMVLAAMHPKRVEFNKTHPGVFSQINQRVMSRADEPAVQFTYYLYKKGKKNQLPGILKRNWADKIGSLGAYQMNKYKNSAVGMIDTIRVCHAKGTLVDELMRTGSVKVEEDQMTWETLRSAGKSWKEISEQIKIPQMALMRNLRGMFTEIDDLDFCKKVMEQLKRGVPYGKQFPFRYWSAYKAIENSGVHHKPVILDALEECIDLSCENIPKLKGKTMVLSDNSGSAWDAFTSEYGTVEIAEIDNLSAVIAARNSEEGYVGKFGDKLKVYPVSKRNGVLSQTKEITSHRSNDVGGATENGIWIFFRDAIENNEWWDNIFCYSDMQAGHGGLYGTRDSIKVYREAGYCCKGSYIDVAKLLAEYRRKVNPKVNFFSIQTAGYTNVVVPEYGYRTNIMYGWTSKELLFADTMIKFWDQKDKQKQ